MPCGNSVHFQECGVTGGDFVLTSVSPPQNASPGTLVTVPITVKMNCLLCLERVVVIVYLSDVSSGNCIYDTGELSFVGWGIKGSTIDANLSYFQPTDSDFNGKISVVQIGNLSDSCTDSHTFAVKTNYPPVPVGQGWSCNPTTNKCFADPTSTVSYTQCHITCEGGTGTGTKPPAVCDPNADMNIMGICVPKPLVLGAFALGAIYIFKK
jgi:hypothetical protein